MTQSLYLSRIRQRLPGLSFHQVEIAGGQFHDVLLVNEEWVFRFPRYREGVSQLITESHLLDALQGRLSLAIPKIVLKNFEPPVPGLAFIGYRRISGSPITAEKAQSLPNAESTNLASQLANFLLALHNIPLVEIPAVLPGSQPQSGGNPKQVKEQREDWEEFYAAVRSKLFDAMRGDARKKIADHFEAYLDDKALQAFLPCLRHGDFGGDNILWDPLSGQARGVIDFSFCAVGDPAMDLASISTLGDNLFGKLASFYEPDDQKRELLLARARFYRGTFALMEALDGLRDGDSEAYQRGMEQYR